MNKKIFTIIIPVYNAEKTIERTLASLISNKDFIYEVIIVNDNCTDTTLSKIDSFLQFFPIHVIDSIGKKSPGAARLTGIHFAESEWLTFVDADDCLTPSSLYYVYREIQKYPDLKLLHAQTIYYESGSFDPFAISRMDNSCGGNFYNLKYLIENDLYPHMELKMAEDEYFNEKINRYITYCDPLNLPNIKAFEYPVYEVHHDIDEGLSFALSNWVDYLCKYHLEAEKELIIFFKDKVKDISVMKNDYIINFIFCFYLIQGLIQDEEIDFSLKDNLIYFKEYIKYYNLLFQSDYIDFLNYYMFHKDAVKDLKKSAEESTGINISEDLDFISFLWEVKG